MAGKQSMGLMSQQEAEQKVQQYKDSQQNETHIDRRVKRTQNAIHQAFFKLAQTQDITKISVTALAKEADIDRKTFYLHYDSIEDLIDKLLIDEAHRIAESLKPCVLDENGTFNTAEIFSALNESISKSFSTNLNALEHTSYEVLVDRVEPVLVQIIASQDLLHMRDALGPYLEYIVAYICSGFFAVYKLWKAQGENIPVNKIAEAVGVYVVSGLNGIRQTTEALEAANILNCDTSLLKPPLRQNIPE